MLVTHRAEALSSGSVIFVKLILISSAAVFLLYIITH